MSDVTGMPSGAPCAADVASAVSALQARLRETTAAAFYTRPLQRRHVATLLWMATHYQALLDQRKEE